MRSPISYLKRHTEALVKSVGIENASKLTGKSKATLGRYYSDLPEHIDRFMPIDVVLVLEREAGYPHVTSAIAELQGISLGHAARSQDAGHKGSVNNDVIAMSERFAHLMGEYHRSIEDGVISANEAKRLLKETTMLQQVLIEMKLHLEDDFG